MHQTCHMDAVCLWGTVGSKSDDPKLASGFCFPLPAKCPASPKAMCQSSPKLDLKFLNKSSVATVCSHYLIYCVGLHLKPGTFHKPHRFCRADHLLFRVVPHASNARMLFETTSVLKQTKPLKAKHPKVR